MADFKYLGSLLDETEKDKDSDSAGMEGYQFIKENIVKSLALLPEGQIFFMETVEPVFFYTDVKPGHRQNSWNRSLMGVILEYSM